MVLAWGEKRKVRVLRKIQDKVGEERDTGQREGMSGMILRVALAIAVLGAAHGVVYTGTTETSIPPDPVCTLETRTMQVVTISRRKLGLPLRSNGCACLVPRAKGGGEEAADQ